MKRSRGASIDATVVVTTGATPLRLTRDTSEQLVLDVISPQLRQLVDLSNLAVAGLKENAETMGPKHAKFLAMYIGICLRTTFDCITFGDKGLLQLEPVATTCVVPAAACVHSVVIVACGAAVNVLRVDNCTARFRSSDGVHSVAATPHHVMGNLFAIPVPMLPFIPAGHSAVVTVELGRTGGDWKTEAVVEVSVPLGAPQPRMPYAPAHLPLHSAALAGDVTAALRLLDKMPVDRVRAPDEWGVEAASLALFHGHRVIYALATWRALAWPALAVCQLLRARMEVESSLIDGEMFSSVRESVHEFVHDAVHDIRYRPIKYQTSGHAFSQRGPLAVMLLPEVPFTEHETLAPVRAPSAGAHRRGSLDVLLKAIEVLSE